MKNPRKNEPAPFNPTAAGLKLRFAEKKHKFWVFFRHEVPILVLQLPDRSGLRREARFPTRIRHGFSSPTAC
jgi:hypothetical protein